MQTDNELSDSLHRAMALRVAYAGGEPDAVKIQAGVDIALRALQDFEQKRPLEIGVIFAKLGGEELRSIKPSNAKVFGLFAISAEAALAIDAAIQQRWTIPLALLLTWRSIKDLLTVELEEEDGALIWTLHLELRQRASTSIPEADLFRALCAEMEYRGLPPLTHTRFQSSLNRLREMRCIAQTSAEQGHWYLDEPVIITS